MFETKDWEKAWAEAHDDLKVSMQKEISLMRELLANMCEEELSLLLNENFTWNKVMQERTILIEKLKFHREERMKATGEIKRLISDRKQTKEITLDEVLPPSEEISCEILSLRDQLMALAEKMNFQNGKNESLFNKIPSKAGHPEPIPIQSIPKAKRKSSIATYNPNDLR